MNIQFLAALIKANGRIVVPGFGAFLHKENGSIVFSPFLNKDDGLLQAAICRRFGVTAVEAQAQVEAFCEDVKESFKKVGKFYIDGVGVLVCNENGGISLLEESVNVVIPKEEAPSAFEIPSIDPLLSRRAQVVEQPLQPPVQQPVQSTVRSNIEPIGGQVVENAVPRPVSNPVSSMPVSTPMSAGVQNRPIVNRPVGKPQPSWVSPNQPVQQTAQPVAQNVSQRPMPNSAQQVKPQAQGVAGQPIQQRPPMGQNPVQRPVSAQPQGQPVAMGMPQQNMQGQPQNGQRPMANRKPEQRKPQQKLRPQQGSAQKSKLDIWLLVAIMATVLVIILIAWGLINTDPAAQIY